MVRICISVSSLSLLFSSMTAVIAQLANVDIATYITNLTVYNVSVTVVIIITQYTQHSRDVS